MRLPELHKHQGKKHDPNKVTVFHEIGHLIPKLKYGVIVDYVTTLPCKSMLAHVSGGIHFVWDMGYDWTECGPDYLISGNLGGIASGAIFSGSYDWTGARIDLKRAEHTAEVNNWDFQRVLDTWKRVHELLIEHWDIVELAAEKLYREEVLSGDWIEENMLLTRK